MRFERVFKREDQESFAALSGDWNPIHVDSVAARRLLFGEVVVHGIHTLLWALDRFCTIVRTPIIIRRISANFLSPVFLNHKVVCTINDNDFPNICVSVQANDEICVELDMIVERMAVSNCSVHRRVRERREPSTLSFEEIQLSEGQVPLGFDSSILSKLFPNFSKCLDLHQVAIFLASTEIVGMRCPGMHSIFNMLSLTFADCESVP